MAPDTSWSIRPTGGIIRRAIRTLRGLGHAADGRTVAVVPDARWSVRPMAGVCGRPSGKAVISGGRLLQMVQELLTDLAMSTLDGDGRAEAWGDYIVALGNLRAAEREGEPLDAYLDAVADAWDALSPELGCDLYMPLMDALSLGRLLEQTATGAMQEIGRNAS